MLIFYYNVQQLGYNRFGWPLPTPFYRNTTKDKDQPCCPLALQHFAQTSFQPFRNRKSATCRSCHKCAQGAQNPLVTLQPQSATQPRTQKPQELVLVLSSPSRMIDALDPLPIDSSLPQPRSLFIWVGVDPNRRARSLSGLGLTSTQLNVLMNQPTVFHTRWPSVQCGLHSFACGRCHAPHFTVCCIWMLTAMTLVQPCPKCPHLPFTFVWTHLTLLPRRAHIVQVSLGHSFRSTTLWHRWDHLVTYKFGTSTCSHFSSLRTNVS